MKITNKNLCYELLYSGQLGNIIRSWHSIDELTGSGYTGTVTMRYVGEHGGNACEYGVPVSLVPRVMQQWEEYGLRPELVVFNESAPDNLLLLQGELTRSERGVYLFYSVEKTTMRAALKNGVSVTGLRVKLILEHLMTPSSYEDVMALLELYPDHAIELGVYNKLLGKLPGRNTIIWEVRAY